MSKSIQAKKIGVVMMLIIFSGCTIVPGLDLGVSQKKIGAPSSLGGFDLIEVTPAVLVELAREAAPQHNQPSLGGLEESLDQKRADYKVGPGDVLTIIVWDHPQLTSPTGEFRDPESAGRLVGSDGKIFYPYIGELEVAGLTISSIRRLISAQLARVVRDPQVDVRVAAYRSQRVKVTGEVVNPSVLPITDQGLSVIDAIAAAGGLADGASRHSAVLTRRGVDYHIKLRGQTELGLSYADVALRHGDVLHVPNSDEYSVYVLGAVGKQGSIPLPRGSISLAEAISTVDGLNETTADRRRVYVLRTQDVTSDHSVESNSSLNIYVLDMSNLESLILSEKFDLFPRDVVYVDRTGLATYNSVVSNILPTVSTLFQLDRLLSDD